MNSNCPFTTEHTLCSLIARMTLSKLAENEPSSDKVLSTDKAPSANKAWYLYADKSPYKYTDKTQCVDNARYANKARCEKRNTRKLSPPVRGIMTRT